jgi:S1-C subfamily serine protease
VDLLDFIIILLLVAAVASGWRRGLTWVGLSLLGLIVGVILGALIAPAIAHPLSADRQTQALIGTGVFLTTVALVQGIGTAIGYRIRIAALRSSFAELDSWLGSVVAALGVLVGAWYLGLTFATSPFTRLDLQIRNSAILRALDNLAPRPPAFLASLENLLKGSTFGNPFAGLAPDTLAPVPIPTTVDTPGIRAADQVVVKVLSRGCGLDAGSAWPVAQNYLVTNAHVVAGGQFVQVQTPQNRTLDATVVLFDPETDVAILRVPGLGLSPLQVAPADPARGTQGAVIGYPGGGNEQVVPAAVRGTQRATGRDIYGSSLVTRTIEVLDATVIPGDSGGPVVDLNGVVIGLVFASSTVDPTEGYALAITQIQPALSQGPGRSAPVSTGGCAN